MTEHPRIAWIVAFSTKPALPLPFFKLRITSATPLQVSDAGCVVFKLRFEKKTRSNAVVDELRRLPHLGAMWIERRPSSDSGAHFHRVRLVDEDAVLELEPLASHENLVPNEHQDESNDDDEAIELTSDQKISAILRCVHDIQDRVRNIERQLQKQKPRQEKQPDEPAPKAAKTHSRPPIRLSFLRKASVTELFFNGLWVPEYDLDTELQGTPKRECRFRSELNDDEYVDGYDIDDRHAPATAPLEDQGWKHFVARLPTRQAITLSTLRKEPVDVLCCLGLFIPNYDIDDLYAGAPVDRERQLRTDICKRLRIPLDWEGYKPEFVQGYDIDDVSGKARAQELQNIMHHARETLKEARAA
jgi:hypothetical protein